MTPTTRQFTSSQSAAIDSTAKKILCVAGPGAGKSTVLVERIRRLVGEGTPMNKIVAITFTNAAARSLEEKLGGFQRTPGGGMSFEILNADDPRAKNSRPCPEGMNYPLGFVGTLHSFALRQLKKHGAGMGYGERVAIVGTEAATDLLASKAQQLGCKMSLDDLLLLKQEGRPAGRLDVAQTCIAAYYDDLREAGLVDLDSLLPEFLRMLNTNTYDVPEITIGGKTGPGRVVVEKGSEDDKFIGDKFAPTNIFGFDHLLVDEVQDSAEVDWRIYHALPIANKFMVGDSDQAIYSFRGGRVDMMINEAVAPGVEVIALQENFRSHTEICGAANRLIEHNTDRIKKQTISSSGPGGTVELLKPAMNEGEEIARVASKVKELLDAGADANEIAILARTNALCSAYVKTLAACEIPVRKKAEAKQPKDWPVARALVELMVNPHNDTLAYFALVMLYINQGHTPQSARKQAHSDRRCAEQAGVSIQSFRKIVPIIPVLSNMAAFMPFQGVSAVSAESIMLVAERIRELTAGATMLDLALAMNGRTEEHEEEGQGVTVSTIHNYKGREADVVFLVGMEEEIIPGKRKDVNHEEERRLAYVGVTRARNQLFLAYALSRVQNFGRKEIVAHSPSRFLKELGL